jgi:microcystin degradation protein MlrC
VIAGYQTYPHIDMSTTPACAPASAILALLAGQAKPAMAWGRQPMLPHVMRQGSDDEPNKRAAGPLPRDGGAGRAVASVFVGFPNADIEFAGLSAVVVTDGDPARARRWCDELLEMAWSARAEFVYQIEPLAASMARARHWRDAKPAGSRPGGAAGPQ